MQSTAERNAVFVTTAWAIEDPQGRVYIDSTFKNEEHAWHIVLGWPDQSEVDAAKLRGYRAYQAQIYRPPDAREKKPTHTSSPIQEKLL